MFYPTNYIIPNYYVDKLNNNIKNNRYINTILFLEDQWQNR